MNKQIYKLSTEEILKKYPIVGKTFGWYFRVNEISNNVYEIEGTDQWGRLVYRQGSNPEALMMDCEIDASKINESNKST